MAYENYIIQINKVVLEHSHAYVFMYFLWQFLHNTDRVE